MPTGAIAKVSDGGTIDKASSTTHDFSVPAAGFAAGNTVIVRAVIPSDTVTFSSVTDQAGNTYAVDVTKNTGGNVSSCMIASSKLTTALTSGQFVRITLSSAATLGGHISEWSGLAPGAPDKTATQDNAFATTWTSGTTAATTYPDELLIAVMCSDANKRSTPNANWNEEQDLSLTNAARGLVTQYRIVGVTGAYSSGGTWASGSDDGPSAIAAYRAAAGSVANAARRWTILRPKRFGRPELTRMIVAPTAAAGGTTFPQTMTASTVTLTATLQKQVNKTMTATTVALTATVVKLVQKPLTATTVALTATLVATKTILKTLTATTVAITATLQKQVNKPLTATTVALTASLQKQVNKLMTATAVTSTATMIRTVLKNLTATVTLTATLQALKVILKAMTATVTLSASLVKQVNKPLTVTVTMTATLVKTVLKNLTATVTMTATLQALKVILKAMTATITGTATMIRTTLKPLSATSSLTATLAKQVNKTLSRTVTLTATLQTLRVVLKAMTATVTSSATMTRLVTKPLTVTVSLTATATKTVTHALTATVSVSASMVQFLAGVVVPAFLEGVAAVTAFFAGAVVLPLRDALSKASSSDADPSSTGNDATSSSNRFEG